MLCSDVVWVKGLEPLRRKALEPKSKASANSAIPTCSPAWIRGEKSAYLSLLICPCFHDMIHSFGSKVNLAVSEYRHRQYVLRQVGLE